MYRHFSPLKHAPSRGYRRLRRQPQRAIVRPVGWKSKGRRLPLPQPCPRVANHRTSMVTDVYDRHGYADEDKRIMAAVARHVLSIVGKTEASNVVVLR